MTEIEQRDTDPEAVWTMKFKDTEIEFKAHKSGEVYMSFMWNGVNVWEYVGQAGRKSFPNWLRKVADKMEEKV